jgi:hypothetical protein
VVGPDEGSILAHTALVVARSQWLRSKVRTAKESRDRHLEEVTICLCLSVKIFCFCSAYNFSRFLPFFLNVMTAAAK